MTGGLILHNNFKYIFIRLIITLIVGYARLCRPQILG